MWQSLVFACFIATAFSQPSPPVEILPALYTFTESVSSSKNFTVQLSDPIICAGSPAGGCRVVVNFTSHDPRVSTPQKIEWNATEDFNVWQELKTFTIFFNPNAGCDLRPPWTGGSGVNVMEEDVSETDSELYNGFNPSLEIHVPTAPTCETPLNAAAFVLLGFVAAACLTLIATFKGCIL